MEFGTVADWVAAIASLGALGIAVMAWITARSLGARDHERARKDQAERVSAWFAAEIHEGSKVAYGVMLRNSSANPVYEVEVVAKSKFANGTYPPLRLTCLPPGAHWASWSNQDKDWSFPVDSASVSNELRPVAMSGKLGIGLLRFRDGSNAIWSRTDQGALVEQVQ